MSENSTDLIPVPATPVSMANMQMTPALAMLFEQNMAARAWKAAGLYANSSMVPDHFKGKPENCFIALQMAVRTGQDPFMLMQQMYVVHGRPGFFSAYVIGQLNVSDKIKGVIHFEFSGAPGKDDYGCTAWCIEKETGERIDGPKVDWRMVRAEGWDKPKGSQQSKWVGLSDLMFRYRAASYLIRTSFPEVLMGLQTKEELEDSAIDMPTRSEPSDKSNAVEAMLSEPTEPPFNPPTGHELSEAQRIIDAGTAPLAEPTAPPETAEVAFDADAWTDDFCASVTPGTRMKDRKHLQEQLAANKDQIGPERRQKCIQAMTDSNWI